MTGQGAVLHALRQWAQWYSVTAMSLWVMYVGDVVFLCCAAVWLLQVSKGFAVAMQSLAANQTARGVADRMLKAEKAKGAHMNSSLNSKDKLLHDLQAQVRCALCALAVCSDR
jgi:hypothetical protein